jgi:hypothetical protein
MAAPRLKNQNRVRRYRQNPNRAQVGTKKTTQETLMLQRHFTEPPSLNRTAVKMYRKYRGGLYADVADLACRPAAGRILDSSARQQ